MTMAAAKKCDICGKLYEEYNVSSSKTKFNGFMFLNIDSKGKYYEHPVIDCCPECMKKLQDCLEEMKVKLR